ncbi:hypothetical protein DQ04_06101000 [Trypanosoma grayi]|uniref:hypothetical protein n=1 Tax=Trypanosoma grayi TaxID=71804 RepID=UPI0004F43674|nr:hypothetical protein DQ04_06101000 [Trypanosoma grayi]KEG08957.1 hypothetical protein DQ04_06101000 [Trypanosoma grayi]
MDENRAVGVHVPLRDIVFVTGLDAIANPPRSSSIPTPGAAAAASQESLASVKATAGYICDDFSLCFCSCCCCRCGRDMGIVKEGDRTVDRTDAMTAAQNVDALCSPYRRSCMHRSFQKLYRRKNSSHSMSCESRTGSTKGPSRSLLSANEKCGFKRPEKHIASYETASRRGLLPAAVHQPIVCSDAPPPQARKNICSGTTGGDEPESTTTPLFTSSSTSSLSSSAAAAGTV